MHNFFSLILISITYGLTEKGGKVHGGFIKRWDMGEKNARESKIMIKKSKREVTNNSNKK